MLGEKSKIYFRKYHGTEGKKVNSHANTPAAVKMNEINPQYTSGCVVPVYISRLETPGFLQCV